MNTFALLTLFGFCGLIATYTVLRVFFRQSVSIKQFSIVIAMRSAIRFLIGFLVGLIFSIVIQLFPNAAGPSKAAWLIVLFAFGVGVASVLYRIALNRVLRADLSYRRVLGGYVAETAITAILGVLAFIILVFSQY